MAGHPTIHRKREHGTTPFERPLQDLTCSRLRMTTVARMRRSVRGKVRPRASANPREWTIEAVAPYPNRTGSAGLCSCSAHTAGSDETEVYCCDFQVIRNE